MSTASRAERDDVADSVIDAADRVLESDDDNVKDSDEVRSSDRLAILVDVGEAVGDREEVLDDRNADRDLVIASVFESERNADELHVSVGEGMCVAEGEAIIEYVHEFVGDGVGGGVIVTVTVSELVADAVGSVVPDSEASFDGDCDGDLLRVEVGDGVGGGVIVTVIVVVLSLVSDFERVLIEDELLIDIVRSTEGVSDHDELAVTSLVVERVREKESTGDGVSCFPLSEVENPSLNVALSVDVSDLGLLPVRENVSDQSAVMVLVITSSCEKETEPVAVAFRESVSVCVLVGNSVGEKVNVGDDVRVSDHSFVLLCVRFDRDLVLFENERVKLFVPDGVRVLD